MKVAPLAVAALTACGLTACSSPRPTPAAGRRADATAQDAPMADLSTRLILTPSGDRWSIAFELRNGTAAAIVRTYVEPLLAFSLAVTSRDGRDVAVQQPAIDLPSRELTVVVPAGGVATLTSPITLGFGERPGPDAPMFQWTLLAARQPVTVRATLRLDGEALEAPPITLAP